VNLPINAKVNRQQIRDDLLRHPTVEQIATVTESRSAAIGQAILEQQQKRDSRLGAAALRNMTTFCDLLDLFPNPTSP